MKRPSVSWQGGFLGNHSLAHVNRELCKILMETYQVKLVLDNRDGNNAMVQNWGTKYVELWRRFGAVVDNVDFHVAQQWPPDFTPPAEGQWIHFQPWEYGSIPKQWLPYVTHYVDEVWVNSLYTGKSYISSGVPKEKIFVFPLGIDPTVFNSTTTPMVLPTKKTFKFIFVGGTIWRKGIDTLLEAYTKAFSAQDDVALVIKDFGNDSFYRGQTSESYIEQLKKQPGAPEIIYLNNEFTPDELAGLYRSCDCLVHPYRGEGFGLPILEAMASGLPAIIPSLGPAMEYNTPDTAYICPSRIERMHSDDFGDLKAAAWPTYIATDPDDLAKVMRKAFEYPEITRQKGMRAAALVQNGFTWAHSAAAVYAHLSEISDSPIRRFSRDTDWRAIATSCFNDQAYHASAIAWEIVLKENCSDPDALYHLTICNTVLQQPSAGLRYAEQFVAHNSQHPLLSAIHYLMGSNLINLRQYRRALEVLQRAQSLGDFPGVAKLIEQANAELANIRHLVMDDSGDATATISGDWLEIDDEYMKQWASLFKPNDDVFAMGLTESARSYLRERGVVVTSFSSLGELFKELRDDKSECLDSQRTNARVVLFGSTLKKSHFDEFYHQLKSASDSDMRIDALLIALPIANDPSDGVISLSTLEEVLASMHWKVTERGVTRSAKTPYLVAKRRPLVNMMWQSALYDASGYALEAIKILQALRPHAYHIQAVAKDHPRQGTIPPEDLSYIEALQTNRIDQPVIDIQCLPATFFTRPQGPISIGRTMFETDGVPGQWVDICNQFTEIWVPGQFNFATFARGGIQADKLFIVPDPMDYDHYVPGYGRMQFRERSRIDDRFVFLSIFAWDIRKGWDVLLRAFAEEFSPDENVCLFIKTSGTGFVNPKQAIVDYVRDILRRDLGKDMAPVFVETAILSDELLMTLYGACDSFVLPTRGEGWGRPFMEAMAMEVPVIGTDWGGNTEFMNHSNAHLIAIDGLEPVDERSQFAIFKGQKWASPSVASTRQQMRAVYTNYRDAKQKAVEALPQLKKLYSPTAVGDIVNQRLRYLLDRDIDVRS